MDAKKVGMQEVKWGMRINTEKTKILNFGAKEANVLIAGRVLENVMNFAI